VDLAPQREAPQAHSLSFTRMIDLSTGIEHQAVHEPVKPTIERATHEGEGLRWMLENFGIGVEALTASGGLGPAFETITTVTHCGTHVDAPWHYAPVADGAPAKTIDQCPLEWFFGDGVILDVRHKRPNEKIEVDDLVEALARIDYTLKPFDIVLLMNGRDKHLGSIEYFDQPGMTRESTLWLVDQGIKVIGVDMYGFDRKFADMVDEYRRTGDGSVIWEAHFAGREREYCQIEKLVNLDAVPRPTGFKVAAFPIKVEGGSGGWCRAVAFV
jgi:kynurenine formamidase